MTTLTMADMSIIMTLLIHFSVLLQEKIMDIITTKRRKMAYEKPDTIWQFQGIPEDNPVRRSAIFVVHGIGTHQYSDTAIELRYGFEDTLEKIADENNDDTLVPAPFIYEGYWANYAEIEKTFPEEWDSFSDGEKDFFDRLWKRRAMGAWRTALWFIRQNCRVFQKKTIDELGWPSGMALICMAPCTVIAAAMLSVKSPKLFAESLADVRIYCNPQGSVEYAMVQRIDRVVGERFLSLLGLDWDFNELPSCKKLQISGKEHEFKYVTWIAHSLGSVISYNVISDIWHRIREKESILKEKSAKHEKLTEEDITLQHNLERAKTGLHRFYTIGSPLYYIYILFPDVLRPWEIESKEAIEKFQKRWWVNFFHAWDPVSMRLTQLPIQEGTVPKKAPEKRNILIRHEKLRRYFAIAEDLHSNLWRIPGKAHTDYWNDTNILKYVVSRTYGKEVCKHHKPQFLNNNKGTFWRNFLMVVLSIIIIAAIIAAVIWIVFGGGYMWLVRYLMKWIKGLF